MKVEKDAQALADASGVQIFTADIIYHLFDRFTAYMDGLKYVLLYLPSLSKASHLLFLINDCFILLNCS